jgi:hypothetical protein
MRQPSFSHLHEMKTEGQFFEGYANQLVKDPTMYKQYWWVFHACSPVEGWEFIRNDQYRLCTFDAMQLIEKLRGEKEPCMVYNANVHRRGSRLEQFVDPNHNRWKNYAWAPSFKEDEDPVWNGHK